MDSGSDQAIVSSKLVHKSQLTGRKIPCRSVLNKQVYFLPSAQIVVRTQVGYLKIQAGVSKAMDSSSI